MTSPHICTNALKLGTHFGKQGMCYNTHAKQANLLCANRLLLVGEDIPKPLKTHNACAAAHPSGTYFQKIEMSKMRYPARIANDAPRANTGRILPCPDGEIDIL